MYAFSIKKIPSIKLSFLILTLLNASNGWVKSGKSIDIRQITTLDMPDEELIVSLELEAKKHTPLDGTDAIIDYHHLGVNNKEIDKINVLLASTTKNIIKEHATLIKNAGFKPNIFDSDPIAISNNYQFNNELPEEGADVILNIGNSTTNLIVWGKNCSFFRKSEFIQQFI